MTTDLSTLNGTFSTPIQFSYLPNGTTAMVPDATEDSNTPPVYVGFLMAGITICMYGTNLTPVKKFATGDGMFFQWVMCIAIWVTGLIVQMVRRSEILPLCLLGGFLWETGNICVVPIVKTIGLSLGSCLWGISNLLTGWVIGRLGLFGVKKEKLSNYTMNYVGVSLAICSAVLFCLIKSNVNKNKLDENTTKKVVEDPPKANLTVVNETPPNSSQGDAEIVAKVGSTLPNIHVESKNGVLTPTKSNVETSVNTDSTDSTSGYDTRLEDDTSFFDRLSTTTKRILGVTLALGAGIVYGMTFFPAKYLQDHGYSSNGLDYVFSTFCGILATSTVYFLVYAAFQKNKPKVYPEVILPGSISGVMWAVGTSGWFVANGILPVSVAFPIITSGPSVIATLIGVLVFREISGRRNLLVLILGIVFTITGSVLSGLSF